MAPWNVKTARLRTARVAVPAGNAAVVTVTFTPPFPSANYTVALTLEGAWNNPPAVAVTGRTAAKLTVATKGATPATVAGTLHVVAMLDPA
jgi:hypothetical protein